MDLASSQTTGFRETGIGAVALDVCCGSFLNDDARAVKPEMKVKRDCKVSSVTTTGIWAVSAYI